jgi:cytosine/adenosine deaminase-related metal-dependent hydrolase
VNLRIDAANGSVTIAGGRIAAAGTPADFVIATDGTVQPGLINAHEHLHRNHYGRLGVPPYDDAYDWGNHIHAAFQQEIERARAVPRREALLAGAWKNLLAGVTTVLHHDAWEPDFDVDFPLRVARVQHAHSLGFEKTAIAPAAGRPFFIHLAEGVNARAADEVKRLAALGLVNEHLCAVHVVGADAEGIDMLRHARAAIVWCPSSNFFLFNKTAPRELLASGIDVMIGSDSLLTAQGDLLDELRFAKELGYLSDARLLDAVGGVAARRIGLPAASLDVGSAADVIVLSKPVGEASRADVAVVVAGGVLRVLDPALLDAALEHAPEAAAIDLREAARRSAGGRRPEQMQAAS